MNIAVAGGAVVCASVGNEPEVRPPHTNITFQLGSHHILFGALMRSRRIENGNCQTRNAWRRVHNVLSAGLIWFTVVIIYLNEMRTSMYTYTTAMYRMTGMAVYNDICFNNNVCVTQTELKMLTFTI